MVLHTDGHLLVHDEHGVSIDIVLAPDVLTDRLTDCRIGISSLRTSDAALGGTGGVDVRPGTEQTGLEICVTLRTEVEGNVGVAHFAVIVEQNSEVTCRVACLQIGHIPLDGVVTGDDRTHDLVLNDNQVRVLRRGVSIGLEVVNEQSTVNNGPRTGASSERFDLLPTGFFQGLNIAEVLSINNLVFDGGGGNDHGGCCHQSSESEGKNLFHDVFSFCFFAHMGRIIKL